MAEEKKKAESGKKPNGFIRAGQNSVKFFRDCKAEIKKIVWPTPKATFRNMGVVLVAMIIIGLFIFALDTGFGALLGLIMDTAA